MTDSYVIINLVDQFSKVNFGIWHAAIATAPYLLQNWKIQSVLVAPRTREPFDNRKYPDVKYISVEDTSLSGADTFFSQWDPLTTLVVSHGAWQYPTRWGAAAKKLGFRWIYTPHGMLEPWSMKQKWLKKSLYFALIEKDMARKADLIRAVGSPESKNLQKQFSKVKLIPNGVYPSDFIPTERPATPIYFLYLARLHHKKGVMSLVEGWKRSGLNQNSQYQLLIAGTDDGEKEKLEEFLLKNEGINIRFLGPQFGEAKQKLLKMCHYYILPSHSEGFPTSVVEAMAAGLVPVITNGCNFPEAISGNYAFTIDTSPEAICETLEKIKEVSSKTRLNMASQGQEFVRSGYTWERIAGLQNDFFSEFI